MELEEFIELGFSKTESKIYLVLLKKGSCDVRSIVEETGLFKANCYDALEKLCAKGIVAKIIENNKRIYSAQKPESLVEFIQKKKSNLEEQEKKAKKLVKTVAKYKEQTTPHETAIVLRGIAGVKKVFNEIIEEKKDYIAFGSPLESETIIGDYYWKNLHLKEAEENIKTRMIFHKSLRHWKKMMPKHVKLKFLEHELEPLTETIVYGDKIAIIVWEQKPIVTLINNKFAAKSYKQTFEYLWKAAKE